MTRLLICTELEKSFGCRSQESDGIALKLITHIQGQTTTVDDCQLRVPDWHKTPETHLSSIFLVSFTMRKRILDVD